MGVFDILATPEDPTERLIDFALKRMIGYQALEKGSESILSGLTGNKADDEAHQDRILGIALKKRALGLPYDSDDFNEATNQGLSFSQKGALAAFGHKASTLIPDPKFMASKMTPPSPGFLERFASRAESSGMGFPLSLFGDMNGLGKSTSLKKAEGILGAIQGVSSYDRRGQLGSIAKYFRRAG